MLFRSNMIINDLPNIGRETHTYLHHIINNYDSLPEVTIFLPGSADASNKWNKTINICKYAIENMKSVLIYDSYMNIKKLYSFTMEEYASTNEENSKKNNNPEIELASTRPYGLWYEKWFPNININYVSYNCIIAIHRNHIYNRSKSFYEELIKEVSNTSNPEVGH